MAPSWHDPEDNARIIHRLHCAGIIQEWKAEDGGIRYLWNEDFRDGLGGREAMAVFRDVLIALSRFPPLTVTDLYKMSDLGSLIDGLDETSSDF
jgi:hypothetical protein